MNVYDARRFGGITYAQHGDDIVLACIFERLDIWLPSWLDIGAFHPTNISNTALFYARGAHGVNIDANMKTMPAFYGKRCGDISICIGVGPERISGAPFYQTNDADGVDSFISSHVEQFVPITKTSKIDIVKISDVLAKYCNNVWPDLLSLDAEGLDLAILKTAPLPGPKVIIVEAILGTPEANEIREFLETNGYFFCIRCCHNAIFVLDSFKSKLWG